MNLEKVYLIVTNLRIKTCMCANCPFFSYDFLWFKGWRQEALEQSKTNKQVFFSSSYTMYTIFHEKKI